MGSAGVGLFPVLVSNILVYIDYDLLTSSVGFILGYAWKLVLKKPIQKKVTLCATDGKVALMISAAWSLPCDNNQP